jgi:hypothetical protein
LTLVWRRLHRLPSLDVPADLMVGGYKRTLIVEPLDDPVLVERVAARSGGVRP